MIVTLVNNAFNSIGNTVTHESSNNSQSAVYRHADVVV